MSPHPELDSEHTGESDSRSSTDMEEYGSTRSSTPSSQVDTYSTVSSAAEEERLDLPAQDCEQGGPPHVDSEQLDAVAFNISSFTRDIDYPRFRFRSRSVSAHSPRDLLKDVTTRHEEINGLKSFQQVWDSTRAKTILPSLSTDDVHIQEPEPCPIDDDFEFPFFHLSSADFEWREYRFPFFRLDPKDFRRPRNRIKFPFLHLDPKGLGWEHGHEKKPDSPLDKLMKMGGLEEVKKEFLSVQARVKAFQTRIHDIEEKASVCKGRSFGKNDVSDIEKPSIRSLKLDLIVSGTRGTGKSTVAKLYVEFLKHLGITGNGFTPKIIKREGSFDSIDDNSKGVFILEGKSPIVKSMLSYPKARERFSRRLDIPDYSEDELLTVLVKLLKKDRLQVEGGYDAPFLRTFIRRIKQKKWKKFRNVKTLKEEIVKVRERQAERQEKATSSQADSAIAKISSASYRLIESDFIGAKPDNFYERSESWKKLEKMAGMERVKETVRELVTRRHINYAREKEGKAPLKTTFNHVFLGPPGTGKTTVATLFGKIIAELGYIESSEVLVKKPTDFLGKYVGWSEDATKEILEETEGKVLIIDEAHMFYHGGEDGGDKSDIFRKGIVDTIVATVDNEPGNNRCIILMGYEERMKEFYRNTNPGFQRRFPLDTAFVFDDYDDKALAEIMDIMLTKDGITATEEAKAAGIEVLRRERDRPNFGNGGAVRNLISRAQVIYSKRLASQDKEKPERENDLASQEARINHIELQPQDFDPEYDRGLRADKNFRSLFKDLVGFQDIIGTFEGYQRMTANMKQHGLDPRQEIPFSFVFKGPPGTGKTTTARALGEIYHSMGFLSTTEVIDCSVADLISGNGLTGKKVQNLLERGLGKVLFIDEAYRMGQRDLSGAFISRLAQEAVGELVDAMTKEKFAGKLVIVLAGYEKDMDGLMSTNEGMRGRFTEMVFPNMRPKDCLRLLQKKLEHRKIGILHPIASGKQSLDKVIGLFSKLSNTEAWANARDVESIAKIITRQVFMKELPEQGTLDITLEEIALVLKRLYQQRRTSQSASEES